MGIDESSETDDEPENSDEPKADDAAEVSPDDSDASEESADEESVDEESADEETPSEAVDQAAFEAREARLRQLAEDRAEERVEEPRSLLRLLGIVFVLLVIVAYVIPMNLTGGKRADKLLERSMYFCKSEKNVSECAERVDRRHVYCWRAERLKEKENDDVYGRCMHEEFDDFYYQIGLNMPGGEMPERLVP